MRVARRMSPCRARSRPATTAAGTRSGGKLVRLQRRGARDVRLAVLLVERLGRQDARRAAAAPCACRGCAPSAGAGERGERAVPVGRRRLVAQQRARRPGRRRRFLARPLGDLPRRLAARLPAPPRCRGRAGRRCASPDPPTMSLKDLARRDAVALELRRLRLQEPRQRLAGRAPRRFERGALRGAKVAGGDRDQPLADRLPSALALRRRQPRAIRQGERISSRTNQIEPDHQRARRRQARSARS